MSTVCAGVLMGGAGLTGCGGGGEDPDAGTNGVGKLSAAKIQIKTRQAAKGAAAVRLSGTVVSKGQTYKLDMRLKGSGGEGSVTSKGGTFQLLRVGEHLYLKADSGFWAHEDKTEGKAGGAAGDRSAAAKLNGKFVKVPAGDPSYQQLSGFTDKDLMLDGTLALHGKLSKGERSESGTQHVIKIAGDEGAGGTLDVSLEGKPYPVRLQRAGGAGTLRLSEWGKEFVLEEPGKDETVDYGKQLPTQ
ncbi:lipoprotein [Streptomyces flavofungini]|nr:lipoprotein [Streptomyces flavofungini]